MPRSVASAAAAGLVCVVGIWATGLWALGSAAPLPDASHPAPARRVVSMNPSLTSILLAIDARTALVGVEEHAARLHPELASLPLVGGLFNPSLEAVIALEPDLVVLVPSAQQRDFRARVEGLGIEVLELPNITVPQILESIEVLGARVGRDASARQRIAAIRRAFVDARRSTASSPRIRTLVVLQRDPLFVVGGGSFIEEILQAAGAENAAAEFSAPYPRVALEWAVTAAPDVILDASDEPDDAGFWARLSSIPAVANGRIFPVDGAHFTYPGPYLDRTLERVVETLHGNAAGGAE